MTQPTRLQLLRRKGFNLQSHSRAVNGLAAVNCARPGKWGNPARVGMYFKIGDPFPSQPYPFRMAWAETTAEFATPAYAHVIDQKTAIACFKDLIATGYRNEEIKQELRGKNLACWCSLDEKFCHADILLELSNR